jgi:hypothetical protein
MRIISNSLAPQIKHHLAYEIALQIEHHLAYDIARKSVLLINDVVGCVVALEPRLSANDFKFSPVQSDALRHEEREYVEEIGPQFFEEKQRLADEIRTLDEKKTIQLKLLKQFEARAEAWLKKCDPELINLLNKDMEKRRALIENIEKRIEENKKCISLVEEREVKLGAAPSAFVLARDPINTELVTLAPPEKMANNGQRFFAFKAPKTPSTAEDKLTPASTLIPTTA